MLLPFGQVHSDGRLLANLIAIHIVVLAFLGVSIGLRWLVTRATARLARNSGNDRLKKFSEELSRYSYNVLFWVTIIAIALTTLGGITFHFVGHDVRHELRAWYHSLTADDLIHFGGALAGLAMVAIVTFGIIRMVRQLLPLLQSYALGRFGHPRNEATLQRWFRLFESSVILGIRLGAVWVGCQVVGLGKWSDEVFAFTLRVISIIALARLMTLACRATSHVIADHGNRHLAHTPLRRYWERICRLFPFGERCFDAAVYVSATSLVIAEFHFIPMVVDFGPRLVQCIGIFFCTRVFIELLQVLLNEAFGMYKEESEIDQKGRTLVPLIHSMCQYVLYFGSVVVMLGVLGVDTRPILAGAGILGLAVGLGAQSLVTDVVSGFFILFENQYLVGDYVQINDAQGTVEEVGMRVTKIRDGKGKLYIIPNGQIKGVVSYSKGYVNAVVDVKMPAGSDLEGHFRAMKEAGRRLRQQFTEVLADTDIHGLVEWSSSDMTIRAVTKVKPGTHGHMQSEYRRLLKQVFDEKEQAPVNMAA
jgi:moderate conductance mechanosensitive channel